VGPDVEQLGERGLMQLSRPASRHWELRHSAEGVDSLLRRVPRHLRMGYRETLPRERHKRNPCG
jgi:hypothetical protein